MKKTTPFFLLYFLGSLFTFSQMGIHSDLYLGALDDLYVSFPLTSFESGIVYVAPSAVISFSENAQWENASSLSHIDGPVKSYSNHFIFPVGSKGVLNALKIQSQNSPDGIEITYIHDTHPKVTNIADLISVHPLHYWKLLNTSGSGRVTLSWNPQSELNSFLLDQSINSLSIGGYNGSSWQLIHFAFE